MWRDGPAPGSAPLHLAGGVRLLHPDEQVLAGILDGLRAEQLARNLAFMTIGKREAAVRVRPARRCAAVGVGPGDAR